MSLPPNSVGGGGAGGGGLPHSINLSNAVNSASCLSPSDSCGALDQDFRRLFAEQQSTGSRPHAVRAVGEVPEQIQNTDVSYLNYCMPKKVYRDTTGSQSHQQEDAGFLSYQHAEVGNQQNDNSMFSPRKRKMSSVVPDTTDCQDSAIGRFSEMVEDICSRSEIQSDDREEAEWLPLALGDLKTIISGINAIRDKKWITLVPLNVLSRLLRVLDKQIHRVEILCLDEGDHVALESTNAALLLMANVDMPKQIYKEEIIKRIFEFSRHQIMAYLELHKPNDGAFDGGEDEEADEEFGSASKKRRSGRAAKVRKSTASRASAAVTGILQKLCTIVGCIEDLLSVQRLSDICILQLIRTSFTAIQVGNVHLLQLKAVSLISGIYHTYVQHRAYVMDEALQTFLKLPLLSKCALSTYHLPDEEQKQIQIITALLIQLIHCSANLPDAVRKSTGIPSPEVNLDGKYIPKCHEAITESCCLFWSRVLQRLTGSKNQDSLELKLKIENLVEDLLLTLNLPEYPASATILEVLCVFLLQNDGLKSKDIAARSMAIDLLGTIAAQLKLDAVLCRKEKFWILQQLINDEKKFPADRCSVCLDARKEKCHFTCEGCQRVFHVDCLAAEGGAVPTHSSHCLVCNIEEQLRVLKSSFSSFEVTNLEIVQQMLLDYLQNSGSDDFHLFTRWFYLCLWLKDDPSSPEKFFYHLSRLKSKAILRDSATVSSVLRRDAVKKITLKLGQNSSFSRGFDKILQVLLASLSENSVVIRSKALQAVRKIVKADPEVLGDSLFQTAFKGSICDSAISVREEALKLVGEHIDSHPDVGLKYFAKVAGRMKDTAVSVRESAIALVKYIGKRDHRCWPLLVDFLPFCSKCGAEAHLYRCSCKHLVACKKCKSRWFCRHCFNPIVHLTGLECEEDSEEEDSEAEDREKGEPWDFVPNFSDDEEYVPQPWDLEEEECLPQQDPCLM